MPTSKIAQQNNQPDGRSQRRRDNAARLFDVAMQLAKQSGYQSVSVDDICKKADIGRATFFRIYGTKAGLLREFNRRLALDIALHLKRCDGDAIEKLRVVADGVALAWQDGGAVLASMVMDYISNLADGILHAIHQEIFDQVVVIVEEGVTAETFTDAVPAEELASLIMHQINLAVVAAGFDGRNHFQASARTALDCLLFGMTINNKN